MNFETDNMIVLNSEMRSVAKVEKIVEDVAEKFKISPDIFGNILISMTEAVTNAIVHGNKQDDSKKVKIEVVKGPKDVTFKVSDEGNGFDYNVLPDPTAPENLLQIGGRGVFMMKQLADLVVFSDNGSCVEIKFKL